MIWVIDRLKIRRETEVRFYICVHSEVMFGLV